MPRFSYNSSFDHTTTKHWYLRCSYSVVKKQDDVGCFHFVYIQKGHANVPKKHKKKLRNTAFCTSDEDFCENDSKINLLASKKHHFRSLKIVPFPLSWTDPAATHLQLPLLRPAASVGNRRPTRPSFSPKAQG